MKSTHMELTIPTINDIDREIFCGTLLTQECDNNEAWGAMLVVNIHTTDEAMQSFDCLPVMSMLHSKFDLDVVLDKSSFKTTDAFSSKMLVLTDSIVEMPVSILHFFNLSDQITHEALQEILSRVHVCEVATNGQQLLQLSERMHGEGNIPNEDWEHALLRCVGAVMPKPATNSNFLLTRERMVEYMLNVRKILHDYDESRKTVK